MQCLKIAIKNVRDVALALQDDLPFSITLSPVEKAAHELVGNLLAAVTEAENAFSEATK